jgi:hypothetical protein
MLGYYTSYPAIKGLVRHAENILRHLEVTAVRFCIQNFSKKAFLKKPTKKEIWIVLNQLREVVAEVQHHDGITGTSKRRVMQMYTNHLSTAIKMAISIMKKIWLPPFDEAVSWKGQYELEGTIVPMVSHNTLSKWMRIISAVSAVICS